MVNFTSGNITYSEVVKNLNILDYEYYFKFTDFIKENLIHDSLLLFSEIIAKGFDGRLFLNGLASHLRNLMVSKDDRTIKILDHTKETIDKFMIQAKDLENEFITDLLTLVNEADSLYKTSQNQRLHVEILIMKLCSKEVQKKKSKFLDAPIVSPSQNEKTDVEPVLKDNSSIGNEIPVVDIPETKKTTYEITKSEIIRPKTSLSIKKRSAAASITGIRKKINEDLNAEIKDSEIKVAEKTEFTQNKLEEKWLEFAEIKKKEGKIGLFTTLNKQKPKLNKDFSITFIIDSEVQKMEFQTQNQFLLDFLRLELKNGQIKLNLEITKSDSPKLTQLTSRERFFQMADKNPDLHTFKEKFDLDIEF